MKNAEAARRARPHGKQRQRNAGAPVRGMQRQSLTPVAGALLCAFALASAASGNPYDAKEGGPPTPPQGSCPGAGSCYQVHATPGCDEASCCGVVCGIDPSCCTDDWDANCVNLALVHCGNCGGKDAGSCFVANGSPGCNDDSCCAAVCAIDAFCCNTQWDGICANEALSVCGNCGGKGAGNCFAANGTPGCDDASCCTLVCMLNAHCCLSGWDDLCVMDALSMCGNCGQKGAGSCFVQHATPGCDDGQCCAMVCAADPFCCEVEWNDQCVSLAASLCGGCGGDKAGSCFEAQKSFGCDDAECCELICALDSHCCVDQWDQLCVDQAVSQCWHCGDPEAGPCNQAHGGTGCNNLECCSMVCLDDTFCCEIEWDDICVDAALKTCYACGGPTTENCFTAHDSPSCSDADCCALVCAEIDFAHCCTDGWDEACAQRAAELCGNCGTSTEQCFAPHAGTGCGNALCCGMVCALEPFCCETQWDADCAQLAAEHCAGCGNSTESCYAAHLSTGCSNSDCCQLVCASNPFCCEVQWDSQCAAEAASLCGNCGTSTESCTEAHADPGCSDAACCAMVCAADSFCCDSMWDELCVETADELCTPDTCLGDIDLSGDVNVDDLLAVIGSWGPCVDCPADLTDDDTVDVDDLLLVINNWGSCP